MLHLKKLAVASGIFLGLTAGASSAWADTTVMKVTSEWTSVDVIDPDWSMMAFLTVDGANQLNGGTLTSGQPGIYLQFSDLSHRYFYYGDIPVESVQFSATSVSMNFSMCLNSGGRTYISSVANPSDPSCTEVSITAETKGSYVKDMHGVFNRHFGPYQTHAVGHWTSQEATVSGSVGNHIIDPLSSSVHGGRDVQYGTEITIITPTQP